ncbi:hypothetical protein CR164_04355 [Prosthecochloris marina]|uniref:Lycopene cyclase n=1 Tax=Prosthecochloris marina TaxID=2017681 RepID=A0A317T9U3_9CHLB|nr:hypothetical protein [Prosthecochloris marina]PWW82251.1 hypothetical protein CR164_04355 [Prosthecochloris marina]
MFDRIRTSHPLVYRYFSKLEDGEKHLRRVIELDRYWEHLQKGVPKEVILPGSSLPDGITLDGEYDIFYVGGTLGLMHAAVMAGRYGYKVMLIDRHVSGKSTRDWNISRSELDKLEETGVFSAEEIEAFIVRRYRTGWVEFYVEEKRQKKLYMDDVLDCAVDTDRLLSAAKQKILAKDGCDVADQSTFRCCYQFPDHIVIEVEGADGKPLFFKARVLVDVMGILSPIAMQLNKGRPQTHVCPTVGTVASGFRDADYEVGEILASNEHADTSAGSSRQLIWEGFPGSGKEYITYLFFYDAIDSDNDKSLLGLFETYFQKLPDYKALSDDFQIHRPVFGIIPAYSHRGFTREREIADDHILLFGDAASLGSPLTFCGFGSMVRNLPHLTGALDRALAAGSLLRADLEKISAYEPNVASMANLMKYMCYDAQTDAPDFVNELMNEVMIVLDGLPQRYRQTMFRDEMRLDDFVTVLLKVAWRYPKVLKATYDKLGVGGSVSFISNLAGWALSATRSRV